MEIIKKQLFFEIIKQMDTVPFTQSKGWDKYMSTNDNSVYFVDNSTNPTICCRGELYKKPLILRIQGEAIKNPELETIRNFYAEITKIGYSLIFVSSLSLYNIEYEIGIRQAGFIRPLHQTTCPLTILVNTIDRPLPHRSWKNNVKKAINAKCSFEVISKPTMDECEIFAQIFSEMAKIKHLTYTLDKKDIYNLLHDPNFKLFFVYNETGTIVSGRIVYIENKQAWDIYGANSSYSRKNGASYFILDKILDYLSENNIKIFDFGRIGPGINSSNLVYLFKQSSGGYPVQYNGEWIFSKNKYNELALLTYRYILKNSIRY